MAIDMTIRSGTARSFPQPGDTDLFGEVTNWANDVTAAVNASVTTSTASTFDAIVGSAAAVSAGLATHSDITTAIAAVSANDRIFILENNFEPSAQIDIDKALTIIGQGEGAIIEGDNIASGAVVKISATGVTFENVKIIQGSGTPDYALEFAASLERINLDIKADGTFATALFLNGSDVGAITGFISYDTSSVFFGGESQMVEQIKVQDQTTPAYNMVIQSDSDGTALTQDRILTFDVNDGARVVDLSENFTIGDGYDVTITAEDAAGTITLDNSNLEIENTDGTQRLFKIVSAKAGDTTLTFQENFTLADGNNLTITVEDNDAAITYDNVNFEVENTDGTQRTFKITSAKAGDTTLTLQENFTIGDGYDVTITSEDTANNIVLDEQNFEVEGEGTSQRLLKLVNANDANATLTIEGTSAVVNQDTTSDASPTFVGPNVQKITRASNDITVETTTSGDIVLKSADNNIIINKAEATNANTHVLKFGDDTGGIAGIRNNNGVMQFNSQGNGWKEFGGESGINYINNPGAENGTTGYSTFDDGGSYVDGTGGTASNLTFTPNTSSPLRGTGDFDLVVGAADASGEGVSYDFTIDKADKYSVISISFDYLTDAPDDFFSVRIYDVTNSTIIYPTPQDVKASSVEAKFVSQFQTSDSTSYRISIFVNDTDTTGYTINFDNLTVGPGKKLVGTPVTNWVEFDMTIGATGSAPTKATSPTYDKAYWRRVGDSMQIYYFYEHTDNTGAAAGSGTYYFNLPSGYSRDTTKMANASGGGYERLGSASFATATEGNNDGYVTTYGNSVLLLAGNQANSLAGVANTYGDLADTSVRYAFNYTIPIAGWGSNVTMNDIDSNRVTALIASKAAPTLISGTIAAGSALFAFDVVKDTHAAYATGTGLYTCPYSGYYRAKYSGRVTGSGTGGYITAKLVQAGSVAKTYIESKVYEGDAQSNNNSFEVDCIFYAVKGDTISPRLESDFTSAALVSDVTANFLNIEKITGPNNVLASEIVSMRYSTDAGLSISDATTTDVVFEDKDHDTHNMYNTSTGVTTLPMSGKYFIDSYIRYSDNAWTAGQSANMGVELNGTAIQTNPEEFDVTYTTTRVFHVSLIVDAVQGDTIEITTYQGSGSSITLVTSGLQNILSIFKID